MARPEAQSEAVILLRELRAWRLAPQLWERVAGLVAVLDDAVERDDGTALVRAIAELDMISPDRDVRRIGEGSQEGPPPALVLDRVARLIHCLGGDDVGSDEGTEGELSPVRTVETWTRTPPSRTLPARSSSIWPRASRRTC